MILSKVKVSISMEGKKTVETLLVKTDMLVAVDAYLAAKYDGYDYFFKSVTRIEVEDVFLAPNLDAENKFYLCKWDVLEVLDDKIKKTSFKSLIETTSVEAASKKMAELLINVRDAVIVNVSDFKITEFFE